MNDDFFMVAAYFIVTPLIYLIEFVYDLNKKTTKQTTKQINKQINKKKLEPIEMEYL